MKIQRITTPDGVEWTMIDGGESASYKRVKDEYIIETLSEQEWFMRYNSKTKD